MVFFYHFFSELTEKTKQKHFFICGNGNTNINGSCVTICQQDIYKCQYGNCYAHLNGTATCMYGSILSSIFYNLMINYKRSIYSKWNFALDNKNLLHACFFKLKKIIFYFCFLTMLLVKDSRNLRFLCISAREREITFYI